jgi:hypothetical protein
VSRQLGSVHKAETCLLGSFLYINATQAGVEYHHRNILTA